MSLAILRLCPIIINFDAKFTALEIVNYKLCTLANCWQSVRFLIYNVKSEG